MKLLDIKIIKPLKMAPLDSKYWKLTDDFAVNFVTDEGVYKLYLKAGWITDLRSGSDAINCIVPKWGNEKYVSTVLFHDFCWSGNLSRELSNDFLRQGMVLSGEVGTLRASLAYYAVSKFGKYYNMDEELPEPYTINRMFEKLTIEDK